VPYDDAYRRFWKEAGYRTTMGSAATGLPPPKHKIRLYHLTAKDHALQNIRRRRIKLARFSDLNDPFELMSLNLRERKVRNVVREFKLTMDSHTGLLCFSEDWTSPVMWSHYAMKHRGVCLGVDVTRTSVQKVIYKDDRILAELDKTGDPVSLSQKLQESLLCTKCGEWKYEQERRRIVPLEQATGDGGLHFVSFSEDLELAEVILGPNCDASLEEVRELTAAYCPTARVFAARMAWKYFKVVPTESSVP
jgi:hypothetical protein